MAIKLGKLPARRSLKTVPLSNYMSPSHIPFPAVKAWERPISWGMLANDQLGDCTCAAAAHMIMNWAAVSHAGSPIQFTDSEVIAAYSTITGYDPATGANDNGAVEIDVLNYWAKTGFKGHTIAGYAAVDCQNIDMVKATCYVFGGVYLGFQVPAYIMDGRKTWEVQTDNSQIEGGHAIPVFGYGRDGCAAVSWGDVYHMDWEFWMANVDECYAVVAPGWIKQSGVSPSGLDLKGLMAAVKQYGT